MMFGIDTGTALDIGSNIVIVTSGNGFVLYERVLRVKGSVTDSTVSIEPQKRLSQRLRLKDLALTHSYDLRPLPRQVNDPWWRDYATQALYETAELPQNAAMKPEARRCKSNYKDRAQRKRRRFLQKLRSV